MLASRCSSLVDVHEFLNLIEPRDILYTITLHDWSPNTHVTIHHNYAPPTSRGRRPFIWARAATSAPAGQLPGSPTAGARSGGSVRSNFPKGMRGRRTWSAEMQCECWQRCSDPRWSVLEARSDAEREERSPARAKAALVGLAWDRPRLLGPIVTPRDYRSDPLTTMLARCRSVITQVDL